MLSNVKNGPLTTIGGILNLVGAALNNGLPTNKVGIANWAFGLLLSGLMLFAKDPGSK